MSAPRWFANKENLLNAFRSHGFKTRTTTSGHVQVLQPRDGEGPDRIVATLPGTNTLGNRIAKNQIAQVKRLTGVDIRFDPPPAPKLAAAPEPPPLPTVPFWKPGVLGGMIHREDLKQAIREVMVELVREAFTLREAPAPAPVLAPVAAPPLEPEPATQSRPRRGPRFSKEPTDVRHRGIPALTREQAVEAYNRWMAGESQRAIGESMNVTQVSVSRYVRVIKKEREG